jgi:hypothetical protein
MNKLFLLLVLAFTVLAACKKNEDPEFYYDYAPMNQGHYVTYAVREVYIDTALNINDTNDYFLKAVIGDTITDNEGRIARRYERYVRQNTTDPWVLQDIWTTILDGNRVEVVEENQRVIKLVLAPDKLKEWKANVYNMLPELECYYREIQEPATFNGFSFEETVIVEQEDFFSLIDFRRKYERYARGVGMYYKHFKDYKISNFDTLAITKGRELTMSMIGYGN